VPWILGGLALLLGGGLVFKTVSDELDETVSGTGTNLVLLGAAALGGYVLFKTLRKS
jgi:ABC-type uncharacterized transport system permease subunit